MNKQKTFYVILHKEIEREGTIIWSTEVLDKLYMTQDEATRAITHFTGGVKNGLVWNGNKTEAELLNGSKYYDSYKICPVSSKWCLNV